MNYTLRDGGSAGEGKGKGRGRKRKEGNGREGGGMIAAATLDIFPNHLLNETIKQPMPSVFHF